MKIRLNSVELDVLAVPGPVRAMVLSDPVIRQGAAREVWGRDLPDGKITKAQDMTDRGLISVPNAISFLVTRDGADGQPEPAPGPSRKMGERFLTALGAKNSLEILQALTRIVLMPQQQVPLAAWAPLDPVASYRIAVQTDFAVVRLQNTARNLGGYFILPGAVLFSARVTDIPDQAAYDAVIAAHPNMMANRPGYILAPRSEANAGLRRIAMAQRMQEVERDLGGVTPNDLPENDPRRILIARLAREWHVLSRAGQQQGRAVA